MKDHDCIERADKALALKNSALATALTVPEGVMRVLITTRQLNKRGPKAVKLFATYCPFCGKKL